jgi:uncharacterized protein (TIGR02687 family)
VSLLESLNNQIENLYSNNYLLKLNDTWQQVVDSSQRWDAAPLQKQQDFFEEYIEEYPRNQKKVVVIISDAMRSEVGEELLDRIKSEDRYAAELDEAVTMLPSYTQLGMAALLPHEKIVLNDNGTVLVDGQSSQGLENRTKILDQAVLGNATAVRADALQAMTREDSRALFRDNHVVYVYHNQIDAVGDKRESEERVFEAVESALQELIDCSVSELVRQNRG